MQNTLKKILSKITILFLLLSPIAFGVNLSAQKISFYPFSHFPNSFLSQQLHGEFGWFPEPPLNLLSDPSWTDAFDQMHARVQTEFAFTAWRAMDWNAPIYAQIRQKIVAAEATNNKEQYYLALRDYVETLHETHTDLAYDPTDNDTTTFVGQLARKYIGGSFGLIITPTNDGNFIASLVEPNSAAKRAGIKTGAKILTWNNQPIHDAIVATPLTWVFDYDLDGYPQHVYTAYAPATKAGIFYQQLRLLVRAPIDSTASVTFTNPGQDDQQAKTLVAADDNQLTLRRTAFYYDQNFMDQNKYITYKILPSGFGYIRVLAQEHQEGPTSQERGYKLFQAAIKDLLQKNVSGIILDIRGNNGGDPGLSCAIPGFFSNEKHYCSKITAYHRTTRQFDLVPVIGGPQYYAPQNPIFSGPVAVLTDLGTLCGGEVIAAGFKYLSNENSNHVRIFSFDPNTAGSTSTQYQIFMPGNFGLEYSVGQVDDQNGNFISEADKNLHGGIKPDEQIPMTAENAVRFIPMVKMSL